MLALEDIMYFHQLKHEGMSVRAISCHSGYNRGTVTKYLKNGLKEPRYKPRKPGPGKSGTILIGNYWYIFKR